MSDNEINFKTVMEQRFATGQGVVMLSPSMTDEQILTLIKSASSWSKGKAFQVAAYPVADASQLVGSTGEDAKAIQDTFQVQIQFKAEAEAKAIADYNGERYIAGLEYVANGGLDPDGHEHETNAPYYFGHSAIQAFEAGAVWQAKRSIEKK